MMKNTTTHTFRKSDIVLIVVLALAVITIVFGRYAFEIITAPSVDELEVTVSIDGSKMYSVPLTQSSEYPLNLGTDRNLVMTIEDGQVWMKESSCPDQICVHTGKISKNGDFIACLPNAVIITIAPAESE